ncbi:carbohydrate kinase family protein [Sphaerisporangium sp. NPDC051011]|uniref:carbohydrate kinase family protein n=1 Tax=Sphaerisporangium sp. NPDC051011 TaxID=3155792 RepID=UPI0033F069F4
MPPTFDLLVIGDANPDVILGPLDAPLAFDQREQLVGTGVLTLGGSGAIMACGAARLGLRVAFAGLVGDDDAGRYVRDTLAARGVDTAALRMDPGLPTPLTVVITREGDRAILTAPGTLAATTAEDVPERLLTGSRHVHAASYFLMPELAGALPGLFRTARAHGATTSLDTNDDPTGRWDPAGLAAVFAETGILLPNAHEARHLAAGAALSPRAGAEPAGSLETAAAALAARGPLVAVKNGADGALCHDGRTLVTTAGIVVTPADTVGAGDSFDAGFVAATLNGMPVEGALEFAAVCGALSTRAHGGTTAQPTWDEAAAHITRNGENRR